jgi:diaminopimelate decarboxylase
MLAAPIWPISAAVNAHGHLTIGGCDLVELARQHGTPLYVLDEATFRTNCQTYQTALQRHYPAASKLHYASKALLNSAIARLAYAEGFGLDVVSGGELFVALHAGIPAEQIHLHGNAKPRAELEEALHAQIGCLMVDNLDELDLLSQLTANASQPQAIAVRLSPNVATDTHAHIQTGQATSKFGLPLAQLDAFASRLQHAPGLKLVGLHAHLGSQLFDPAVYRQAINVLLDCAKMLYDRYQIVITELSPGGGIGVPYLADQLQPDIDSCVAIIAQAVIDGCLQRNLRLPRLTLEPGRSIVARAGVGIYSILGSKPLDPGPNNPARYLHIDGGMADNIRPALYNAKYTAILANRAGEAPTEQVHIAGRYCESGDVLLRNLALPTANVGDLLAVAVAGAYTLSMASNYNLTPRPPLVLVRNQRSFLIQRRETYADLVQRDL